MSLEQALADNTAALNRVAELLETSNADRAKLLAAAGNTPTPSSTTSDGAMTVADIKEAVKTASPDELAAMLEAEKNGKNRDTAIKAIEGAISANESAEGEKAEQAEENKPADPEPTAEEKSAAASKSEDKPAADDKNAKPVPAEVTGEQAAAAFGAWFGETDDEAERQKRRGFVEQIVAKLGSKVSELDLEGRRKAIFYLRRRRGGQDVDFDAAYDFNGSPTQDAPAAAAGGGDDDLL